MYNDYLRHYGVKGMKWGIRKNNISIPKIKSGRLNIFGTPGHNILYVTGISGSGKSTLALSLAKKLNAEPIHLDWYYDGRSKQQTPFSKYLKANGVNLNNIHDKYNKLNYQESDKIFPLLKKYSENRRLIVEGVQLLDDTMATGMRKYLLNEPVISMQTSSKASFNRALKRDNTAVEYINFQKTKKVQDLFDNELILNIGEAYVQTLLE